MAPKPPTRVAIVGIDPSEKSAGLALLSPERKRLFSASFSIWDFKTMNGAAYNLSLQLKELGVPAIIYAERPRSSYTGKSATDAINTARGFIEGLLMRYEVLNFKKQVHLVFPDQWRKIVFGRAIQRDRDGWKALALRKARATFGSRAVKNDDEAEALLIAWAGWIQHYERSAVKKAKWVVKEVEDSHDV
jgi:Holliday junction resolvasome RuvABC endonuclease subunit